MRSVSFAAMTTSTSLPVSDDVTLKVTQTCGREDENGALDEDEEEDLDEREDEDLNEREDEDLDEREDEMMKRLWPSRQFLALSDK